MASQSALTIRPFHPKDESALLALNAASVTVLSPLDRARFSMLKQQASLILIAEGDRGVCGFLMGFCEGKMYDSKNYQWFSERLKHFFYIDRIVIAEPARSMGIGRQFYQVITEWAQAERLHWLAAEIDIEPANPKSLSFHQRQGFVSVGQQGVNGKRVSLMVKSLT